MVIVSSSQAYAFAYFLALSAVSCGGVTSPPGDPDAGNGSGDAGERPTYPGPCIIETDVGNDDTIDRRDTRMYQADRLLRIEHDNDVNGTLDYIQVRQYDAQNRLSILDEDTNADGVVDHHRVFIYAAGELVDRVDFDTANDGTVDRVQHYQYDGEGRLAVVDDDFNNDSIIDRRFAYKYNIDDQLTRIERDDGPDGIVEAVESRRYEGSLLVAQELDTNADGTLDVIHTHVHDSDGVVRTLETDLDADGALDDLQYWSYDCFAPLEESPGFELQVSPGGAAAVPSPIR